MFLLNRHERLRRSLAALADGELSPRDGERVRAHIQDCPNCAALLEDLRAASSSLAGLPAAQAPRSFALTPEMVPTTPASRPAPAYATGLRYATAGLAIALAVVMFADRASVGDDSSPRADQAREMDGPKSLSPDAPTESASDSQGASGPQYDVAGAPAATSSPPVAAGETTARSSPASQPDSSEENAVPEPVSGATDQPVSSDTSALADGGSIGAIEVVEIVLALLLLAGIASLGLVWLSRRAGPGNN